MSVDVRDLGLDLDAFEGPFDVLLTLLLKEELELADVDVTEIVLAFMEELHSRDALDLEASGEFLVLISSLLELKGRELFGEDVIDLEDLDPGEIAEELAERLATYRRFKEAASWLRQRLADDSDRYFRLGPAPLAPQPSRPLAAQDPERLAEAIRTLTKDPPEPSLRHLKLTFPPVSLFLERFRAVIRRQRRFSFDEEVANLSRIEQAVAFLALLEMRKAGEVMIGQRAPFEPITAWTRPLRLIDNPVDRLARTIEALLVVASRPLTLDELAHATADDPERVETALGLLGSRYRDGKSGIVLEQVARGYGFRASRETADACARLVDRPVERNLSQAALETLAIVAYLGPVSRPEIARIRGVVADSAVAGLVERGLITEARRDGPGGAVRYSTTPLFERVFRLNGPSELPKLDELVDDGEDLRSRLETVAQRRTA